MTRLPSIAEVQAAHVTAEMLMRVNALAVDDRQRGIAGGDAVVWTVIALANDDLPEATMMAVGFRVEALAKAIRTGELRGIYIEDGPGKGRIRGEAFTAAALAELMINRRGAAKPRFDTREFQRLVMGLIEEAGRA